MKGASSDATSNWLDFYIEYIYDMLYVYKNIAFLFFLGLRANYALNDEGDYPYEGNRSEFGIRGFELS